MSKNIRPSKSVKGIKHTIKRMPSSIKIRYLANKLHITHPPKVNSALKSSEPSDSGLIYVTCNDTSIKKVLEKANNSKLNVESYKTKDDSINVVINLKGTRNEIKTFSKQISEINGVNSVQYFIT